MGQGVGTPSAVAGQHVGPLLASLWGHVGPPVWGVGVEPLTCNPAPWSGKLRDAAFAVVVLPELGLSSGLPVGQTWNCRAVCPGAATEPDAAPWGDSPEHATPRVPESSFRAPPCPGPLVVKAAPGGLLEFVPASGVPQAGGRQPLSSRSRGPVRVCASFRH